ncbi:MAG TPA: DUF1501 domain-containing protein [Blastocatellia bacterium]|nr:DUF1501 domain-containing protein [Blastocatellia bacterium]
MPVNRRRFIKQGIGMVSLGVVMPRVWLTGARAQTSDPNRRVLVVIQLSGGNDGLNTVIPYTDPNYRRLRPNLGFKEADLKDGQGRSTIISNQFGFHPALAEVKQLFDDGKVAVVLGVGYPEPSQSHFLSEDYWHTANLVDGKGSGWLGRYAEEALAGQAGFHAAAIGGRLPRTLMSDRFVVPSIFNFSDYGFRTSPAFPANRPNKLAAMNALYSRRFPEGSFKGVAGGVGFDAVSGSIRLTEAIQGYTSTVVYPDSNPLARAMKMVAQMIVTIPEANLLHAEVGGFDNHAEQITDTNMSGLHALLLQNFSQAVKLFHDDMAEHGLADNVLILPWSEFGRRPEENGSRGTDHGSSSCMFVIGNKVRGGLYGEQPSLAAADLDVSGNLKSKVDFRSVYATVLEDWLDADSNAILRGRFDNLGVLASGAGG